MYTNTLTDPRPVVLIGGGGHALVVAEAAMLLGVRVAGVLDDDPNPRVCLHFRAAPERMPRMGSLGEAARYAGESHSTWILALGGCPARRRLLEQIRSGNPAAEQHARTLVHPSAVVSPSVNLGPGVFVGPGAIVHTLAKIGPHAIVNTGAIVEHECDIGENTHIAPRATLGGACAVGNDAIVGIGASVRPCTTIGRRATVGAGSAVVEDLPEGGTYAGVPAREIGVAH